MIDANVHYWEIDVPKKEGKKLSRWDETIADIQNMLEYRCAIQFNNRKDEAIRIAFAGKTYVRN